MGKASIAIMIVTMPLILLFSPRFAQAAIPDEEKVTVDQAEETVPGQVGQDSANTGAAGSRNRELQVPAAIMATGTFTIGRNFTGSSIQQSGFIPPDTMGTVGENHIVELINGRFAVYDKNGVQLQASSLNAFWISAGVAPAGAYAFDPRVVYDKYSGRWFAVSVDNARNPNNFLLAVSTSSDPTAGWTGFQIDSDSDDSHWADFPTLGLNQDVVVVQANMFGLAGQTADITFLVLSKSDLLAATPTVSSATLFENRPFLDTGYSAQPAFDQDNGNLPLLILSAINKPAGFLKTSAISGTASTPSLITGGGLLSVAGRDDPPDINQPGPKADIDASNTRFSGNVIVQQIPGRTNPSLWAAHGVDAGGRAAVEWYEIDAVTNAILQSGVISDTSLAFNYPSIAVNDFGDVVIGFSGGDPNTFMSTYVAAGKTVSGTTTFTPPQMTRAGVDDYEILNGGRNRWGDYSATVVDPANETRFWTFQEFVSAEDAWSIQVTEIIMIYAPVSPTLTITRINSSDARLNWTADPRNCGYVVHRNFQPYFIPDGGTAISSLLDYTTAQFHLPGAIGDLTNKYYEIEAAGCGGGAAFSHEAGIFHFAIVPGN